MHDQQDRRTGRRALRPSVVSYRVLMIILRRSLFALTAFVMAIAAGILFGTVITANGMTWLHVIQIALLVVCCLWLAWGFMTAIGGMIPTPRPVIEAQPDARRGMSRTAILVPVYNEDAVAVFARVAAMIEGLRAIAWLDRFDVHVLSDSTRAECVEEERRATFLLAADIEAGHHLYYRNRTKNIGRKAGNIADFVTNSGGAYEYMLVLDADSLMRPETMVEMVLRMDRDEELALLQTQPLIIGRRTLFGRALQFSAALYSPIFSRGIAYLQGKEGPFWGHNAIIRTRAFAACCGLPDLPGKAPFGGHILSHDYVEAALLARGGYKVRVDTDLRGSYEEAPTNVIEYAKRDRRWCQGNLQHSRLLRAPGLKLWSRISLINGIMAYAASPIWLLFLIVSLLDPILAPEPNYFPGDTLFPVFPQPETGKALLLLLAIFLLLLLPKTLIAFSTASGRHSARFGGAAALLAGATVELVLTSILAPIMMMFQSKAVAEILIGADSGWPATDREDGALPLGAAFSSSWWMVIAGAALLAATSFYAPNLVPWTLPIAVPLVVSPFLISLSGDPALGDALRRWGIFLTPFELQPEPVIRSAEAWRRRLVEKIDATVQAAAEPVPAAVPVRPAGVSIN
ncbi:glucans biosynthesis glucosyltransferase MdoH [Mangrovibrevibacter kandeliae]|uniref:glucans biosynthesis glucosyltransferase MdoH n=1 Tax=Mangrovibrevibacter kandeliae TaxID=2968473 RepID=UPI0021191762|nr:glucans biosynthesis glucosyltransferase MdoH [Aurantimonas sp. CSK15Z-1]MCQ8783549.1 glucans biosynthesis glucosyltransferase MdoH [Aurantimonas sp. CSK15Z-1]